MICFGEGVSGKLCFTGFVNARNVVRTAEPHGTTGQFCSHHNVAIKVSISRVWNYFFNINIYIYIYISCSHGVIISPIALKPFTNTCIAFSTLQSFAASLYSKSNAKVVETSHYWCLAPQRSPSFKFWAGFGMKNWNCPLLWTKAPVAKAYVRVLARHTS